MLNVINREYREIPADLLHPHPHNPNRGDMAAIGESVEVNGFYGAVTVRDHPTIDGEYEILAGEHRWRTAIAESGDPAVPVPCIVTEPEDDVHAARILLADNETAKRSTYDADELTQVLRFVGSVEGTGFDLAGLADFEDERQRNEPDPSDGDEDEASFVREYGVVVYADDEEHQQTIYEKLRAEGLRVRVASI